jgi:hypothetical protein
MNNTHSASATAGTGFDDHGKADLFAIFFPSSTDVTIPSEPGTTGTLFLIMVALAVALSPIISIIFGRGADKFYIVLFTNTAELGIFGKKP